MLRYSGLLFLLETYAVDRLSPFSSFLIITPSIGVQAASAQRASWPSVPTLPALLLIYWPLVFSLLLRPSATSSPATNQIGLRIDHLVCGVLPELNQVPSRLRTGSRFWSEIDLP